MFNYLKIICAVLVVLLSGYQLITKDFQLMPYMQFILGIMLVTLGAEELKKQQKLLGYSLILTAIFLFIVLLSILVF